MNPSPSMTAEIAVVGAGPAGIAAAARARENGASVLVLDDNPAAGGQIWRGGEDSHKGSQPRTWFDRFREARIPMLTGAQVISAVPESRTLLLETWQGSFEVCYCKLIIATGAREIFLPFPGWTLPGVAGAGGLQALAKSGLSMRGKSIIIAGSGPLLLAVASNLRKLDAKVKLIAEQASHQAVMRFALGLLNHPGKIVQAAALQFALLGVPYRYGCWIESAEGNGHLERVRLRQGNRTWTEECDYAAVAFGLYPNIELPALLGCRLNNDSVEVDDWQRTSLEDVYCAGECTGIGGVDLSLIEGEIAGHTASGNEKAARALFGARRSALDFARKLNSAFALRPELRSLPQDDTFVCRCEDITYSKLKTLTSFRGAKLQTRCGMGPCQGRVCGPATQFLFGWRAESIRPPIFPARVGSLVVDEAGLKEAAPTPQ